MLLVEEFFSSGNQRFWDELVSLQDPRGLRAFAERWSSDTRPFARAMQLKCAIQAASLRHHRPLIKMLFKKAEAAGDDELVGHFLVGFDAIQLRQTDSFSLWFRKDPPAHAPRDGRKRKWFGRWNEPGTFSRTTWRYLQRRAWRYFRRLGHTDPARYRAAMVRTLALYEEQSLASVPRFLDSWGLVHALYAESPVLVRDARAIVVRPGRILGDLTPAPMFPDVWRGPEAFTRLLQLFLEAKSNPVRRWALALLRRDHVATAQGVSMDTVRRLLRHDSSDAQALGVELLGAVPGLDSLPLADWLALLRIEQPSVMPTLVRLLEKYVSPERLTLEQCVSLACSKIAPVAELGFTWAKAKPLPADALGTLLGLANARVESVRAPASAWLVQLINLAEGPSLERTVRELLDAPHLDVRSAALGLMSKDARFGTSVKLWSAMSESPWPDVRETLSAIIERHESGFSADELKRVWATTLLSIHRGSREKRAAVNQLARRIAKAPNEAPTLLPVLAHSLRSVRPPERRAALAALAQACFTQPGLLSDVSRAIPELRFVGSEVSS